MKSIGVFQSGMDLLINASRMNKGIITIQDIADYILHNQCNELDNNIGVAGQNGIGKSFAALLIAQAAGGIEPDNYIYAYHPYHYLINRIGESHEKIIFVDELTEFFAHKEHMTKGSIKLFRSIEIARAHKNCILSCFREATKINNNYRNGKLQVLIQMVERFANGDKISSIGAVLLANPFYEGEDKFFLSLLRPTFDVKNYAKQLEELPSFIGFIEFPNAFKNRKLKNTLQEYYMKKEIGIMSVSNKNIKATNKTKDKDDEDNARVGDSEQSTLFNY